MTQATINGKKVSMTVYQKAKLLNVSRIAGEEGFIVSSGSDPHTSYRVTENCRFCSCQTESAFKCSHRIAADWRRTEEMLAAAPRQAVGYVIFL